MKINNSIMLSIIMVSMTSIVAYTGGGTNLQSSNPSAVKRYSYSTGTVEANLKSPKKGDPVDMAYEFLELNKDVFRMKEPRKDMVVEKATSDDKISRVILKQVYHGITVDAGARLWFYSDGRVSQYEITYYDDINLSTTPSIDSATAENLALKDLGFPKDAKIVQYRQNRTRLMLWRDNNDKFHLTWVVWVSQDYPKTHAWEYYIDAHDGTVLNKADRMIRN